MDLMTQSTAFALLRKKYREFAAPTAKIKVEGVDLKEKLGASFGDVEVDLTSEFPASGASFDLWEEYEFSKTEFRTTGPASVIELGAKVEIELGYIDTVKVFSGLITEIQYRFDEGMAPYIHVECMDAKCLLMKSQQLKIHSEVTIPQLVKELLSASPAGSYITGKQIETMGSQETIPITAMSDYDFIVRQAQYTGSEFFIIAGKAYFRPKPSFGSPIMSVQVGETIVAATMSLRGNELVETVKVVGADYTEKAAGSAKISGNFGKGPGPNRMISGSTKVYYDSRALTDAAAEKQAKALVGAAAETFGVLECKCIGLPDLVPGRFVKVSGLLGRADDTFYISNLKHHISTEGFTTTFEARINGL